MEVVYERCCGLDIHKKKIVACIITGRGKAEIRTFGTMTDDILSMIDWIKKEECQSVAMESTGSFWKPVYNLLEMEGIKTLVVNAQHIKTVPGRKTDVKDAEWIADLLRHGLLKGSFIQNKEQRELKELVRYRRSIVDERAREINRIQKVLEGANIKLSSVVSDIMGVSAREMLNALANGESEPQNLATKAKGTMKNRISELKSALKGIVGEHQQFMLLVQLKHIENLESEITQLDEEVSKRMRPYETEVKIMDEITGVGIRSAQTIISEIGVDMDRFPTAAHLASWAGMCPGNNESAGKKKNTKTRKGNKTLRTTLVECARAAALSKDTYLSSQYKSIGARRGYNRAAVAVGHSILIIAYHLLKNKSSYNDLGANYFNNLRKKSIASRAIKRLEALGYKVNIIEEATVL
jgi:transposase